MKEITMAKHNNNAKKSRYRFLASFLAVILMLGCMMIPDTKAQASSLSLRVSTSSVKIGDTVTVSITVPAGVSATVNVTYPSGVFSFSSASDTASSNGGTVSMTIGSYGSTNTKTTGTMKFKAKAAGSATFSASAPIAGNQDGDRVTVGGASASVSVKNESNDSTNDNSNNGNHANDGEDNTHKSADNSLASLTLSSGTLSPAFKYNVTNYTAEVANDVTSVVVSAKPSNANATVESVNGGENLAVGANKIQVEEAMEFFANIPKIYRKLKTLFDVGLGYVKLGQPATTLSGGEAQRVKLATELSKRSTGKTIYILDEPTTGLHIADVHRLVDVLQLLVEGGNTVVVIEHNLDLIKTADYIIDLGPEGGDMGGEIVALGTPEQVAENEKSFTGQYLKPLLNK